MCSNKKWQCIGKLCAFIMIVGILLWGAAPVCAAEDSDERSMGPTKTAEVTIQRKTKGGLLTKELTRVKILKDTIYVDQSGRKIPYDALSVPCNAVLVYEPVLRGDPLAVSVTVKKLLPGSTSAFQVVPE